MDINEIPDPTQQQGQQQQSQQFFDHQPTDAAATIFQQSSPKKYEIEVDSSLLQQFSCLGTTDHEDLINELVKIMNNQLSREGAKFFLEMSNWNLHAAIGCYMDLYYNDDTNLPSMQIVGQKQLSEYKQIWQLQNNGSSPWPSGCYLSSPSQKRKVEVPSIQPGETCDIVAEIPPTSPPLYWRLCIPSGTYFGDTIWMVPCRDATYDLAQRMSQLCTTTSQSASISSDNCPQVNIQIVQASKMFDC